MMLGADYVVCSELHTSGTVFRLRREQTDDKMCCFVLDIFLVCFFLMGMRRSGEHNNNLSAIGVCMCVRPVTGGAFIVAAHIALG